VNSRCSIVVSSFFGVDLKLLFHSLPSVQGDDFTGGGESINQENLFGKGEKCGRQKLVQKKCLGMQIFVYFLL